MPPERKTIFVGIDYGTTYSGNEIHDAKTINMTNTSKVLLTFCRLIGKDRA